MLTALSGSCLQPARLLEGVGRADFVAAADGAGRAHRVERSQLAAVRRCTAVGKLGGADVAFVFEVLHAVAVVHVGREVPGADVPRSGQRCGSGFRNVIRWVLRRPACATFDSWYPWRRNIDGFECHWK